MDDFDFIFTVFYKHFLFLHFQLHIGTMDLSKDVLQQPGMFCIALHSISNEIVMDPTRSASLFLIFINHGWMQLQKTRHLANSASENAPKTTSTAAPMSALMMMPSATAPLISSTAPPTCKAERELVAFHNVKGKILMWKILSLLAW